METSARADADPIRLDLRRRPGAPRSERGRVKSVACKRVAGEWVTESVEVYDEPGARRARKRYPTATIVVASSPRPRTGRAPRRSTNTRRRNSRRTSGTRAGPSDDPDDDEAGGAGRHELIPEGGATAAATDRTCVVCGTSIADRRPQAITCSDACRQTKRRGRKRPAAVVPPRPAPQCSHPLTAADEHGDPICVLCGWLTDRQPFAHWLRDETHLEAYYVHNMVYKYPIPSPFGVPPTGAEFSFKAPTPEKWAYTVNGWASMPVRPSQTDPTSSPIQHGSFWQDRETEDGKTRTRISLSDHFAWAAPTADMKIQATQGSELAKIFGTESIPDPFAFSALINDWSAVKTTPDVSPPETD